MKSAHLIAIIAALLIGWGVYSLLTPSAEAPHLEQNSTLPPCEETAAGCPEETEGTAPVEEVASPEQSGSDVGMEMPIPDAGDTDEMVACTMDAKQCPDGSYVGRVAPNCEFAACPSEAETTEHTFTISGTNFAFDVTEMRVKEGDTVTVNFESADGFHDWVVDEFNAATEKVRPGTPTSVTFVADKKGTYEYYCSVGSHRANGMVGTLIVE